MSERRATEKAVPKVEATVGYGKPPVEHQFKKGCSGNKRGRPKKRAEPVPIPSEQYVEDLLLQEAYRMVSIRDGDKVQKMPAIQAAMRGLTVAAIKGSHRAQVTLKQLTQAVEDRRIAKLHSYYDQMSEYKWEWEREFERCDQLGEPRPDVVPHPADIQVDEVKGEVRIVGPKDKLQRARWNKQQARKQDAIEAIAEYQKLIRKNPQSREFWDREIAFEQHRIRSIDYYMPDEATRRSLTYDPLDQRKRPERFRYDAPAKPAAAATKAAVRRTKANSAK